MLLLALFAQPAAKPGDVVAGQYLGMAVLVVCAMALAALAVAIPHHAIGLLGLLPLSIGLTRLVSAWRARGEAESEPGVGLDRRISVLSVALITIANGGDNVAVYVPLFAHRDVAETLTVCAVLGVMVAIWCFAAQWVLETPQVKTVIQRGARWTFPFVLIVLGLSILVFE